MHTFHIDLAESGLAYINLAPSPANNNLAVTCVNSLMNRLVHRLPYAGEARRSNIYTAFADNLQAIWRVGCEPRPLGLAISGGVDSMALATLCREAAKFDVQDKRGRQSPPTFTGFIVDHKLRNGSEDEARKVADELVKLGIAPRVLRLDWTGYSDPTVLPNLESIARRLRYQALGQACREAGIENLLVGHHADDQAETVLIRLLNGYTGSGLAGIKASVPLPECSGIYGVDHSGQPQNWPQQLNVEAGGVRLVRPLLGLRKEQLLKVCEENGTPWFEDKTNADPTLTIRNAVRRLLGDEHLLPTALRQSRLCKLAESKGRADVKLDDQVAKLASRTPVMLNVRSGQAVFGLRQQTVAQLREENASALHLLRRMLALVSPQREIALQSLHTAAALLFDSSSRSSTHAARAGARWVQIAGVNIRPIVGVGLLDRAFTMSRALPPKAEQSKSELQLWPPPGADSGRNTTLGDAWRLWDGRYWLRVDPPDSGADPELRVVVRFLNADGLTHLREMSKSAGGHWREAHERLVKIATFDARLTMPALFTIVSRGSDEMVAERLVALPSLGWYAHGWTEDDAKRKMWRCEIRYKHVDLDEGQVQDGMTRVSLE